jgi:Autographiviridae endonuclease VII
MDVEKQREYRRNYMRKYNASKKGSEYNRNHVKQWRKNNPEKRRLQAKRESGMDKIYNQRKHLKATYGITVEDYNKMFEKQKGCCAICKEHQTNFKKRLSVDHNHKTGQIRQLLCYKCNSLLGYAKENKIILEEAIKYLEYHRISE